MPPTLAILAKKKKKTQGKPTPTLTLDSSWNRTYGSSSLPPEDIRRHNLPRRPTSSPAAIACSAALTSSPAAIACPATEFLPNLELHPPPSLSPPSTVLPPPATLSLPPPSFFLPPSTSSQERHRRRKLDAVASGLPRNSAVCTHKPHRRKE